MLQQLLGLFKSILSSAPECLLVPKNWKKYGSTLQQYSTVHEDIHLQESVNKLSQRNAYLQNQSPCHGKGSEGSPKQRLIALLDSLFMRPNYSRTADACIRTSKDDDMLVWTCVEWSSSIHRYGLFRIYAATRLLRIWSQYGIELQNSLLKFLGLESGHEDLDRKCIYRLIAGLISSKHLSIGRYLQWLMARGSLNQKENHRHVSHELFGLAYAHLYRTVLFT